MRNFLSTTALILGLLVLVVLGAYIYWAYSSAGGSDAAVTETAAGRSQGSTTAGPTDSAFVHRATSESISSNSTYLNNRMTNGKPDAILSVTQNWNPKGNGGTYNDHSVGVWYDGSAGRWAIFNEDRAPMPEGASFNVVVFAAPSGTR